jgi:hypothetical protein
MEGLLALLCLGLWGTSVWICASMMDNKGRSSVVGCLIGLLFGLVGIVIVYFIPPKTSYYTHY